MLLSYYSSELLLHQAHASRKVKSLVRKNILHTFSSSSASLSFCFFSSSLRVFIWSTISFNFSCTADTRVKIITIPKFSSAYNTNKANSSRRTLYLQKLNTYIFSESRIVYIHADNTAEALYIHFKVHCKIQVNWPDKQVKVTLKWMGKQLNIDDDNNMSSTYSRHQGNFFMDKKKKSTVVCKKSQRVFFLDPK